MWRSSLLGTVVGYAARGVGLSKSQKVAARYNAQQQHGTDELQKPSESLQPVSADRVAEWLATQERSAGAPRLAVAPHSPADAAKVEEMFDMLDPVKKSDMSPAPAPVVTPSDGNDFYAFFAEVAEEPVVTAPVAVAEVAPVAAVAPAASSDPALSFEDVLYEPRVSAPVEDVVAATVVDRAMDEALDEPMDDVDDGSTDRALTSVEDLYEAFKRLEQQLDTISDSLQTYNQHP